MKYTMKYKKDELLYAANSLQEEKQVLVYLLLLAITVGVLFQPPFLLTNESSETNYDLFN